MAFLTDQTSATGVNLTDLFHVVDPNDLSQGNPAGSSYKATFQQVIGALTGGTSVMVVSSGVGSVERCGNDNEASSFYSTVSGGRCNTSSCNYSTIGGGYCNISSGLTSTVGGGDQNISDGFQSTIAGGAYNVSSGDISTVGGGCQNTSSGLYGSTVSGGYNNKSISDYSTVSGGLLNISSGGYSTVGGGQFNISSGGYSTVGGGQFNTSSDYFSTVSGGQSNISSSCNSTVSGGYFNQILTGSTNSTIGGGYYNQILTGSTNSTIGGGRNNTSSGNYSAILGGSGNTVTHNCSGAFGLGVTSISANTFHVNNLALQDVPVTDSTNNDMLVRDVSTGVIKTRNISTSLNKNYASFYDTGDQTGLTGTVLTMSANTSDSWNTGITLSANTIFVIQNPGVYSLAFSAQMVKTGGNSNTHAHIWLYQNGLDVPNSASQIGFPSNSLYVVPAWNFFFSTTTPNEYVELKWEINSNADNQLFVKHQPAAGNVPEIPSLIVTINQVN